MKSLWPKREKADLQLPFYWYSRSREVMGGESARDWVKPVCLGYSSQREEILVTWAGASIHPTPPLPGFPAASVQPRVWNSIQEQA